MKATQVFALVAFTFSLFVLHVPHTAAQTNTGIIYAVTQNDDLLWYRHDGRNDGTFKSASNGGSKVGNGWNFKHVFSGGDGIIYAITQNDEHLLWYRHDGRNDGTFRWASNEGRKVGNGWNFKHVFSGGDGIIYAITRNDASCGTAMTGATMALSGGPPTRAGRLATDGISSRCSPEAMESSMR